MGIAAIVATACVVEDGDDDADGAAGGGTGGSGAEAGSAGAPAPSGGAGGHAGGGAGETGAGEGGAGGTDTAYVETCGEDDDNDTAETAVPFTSTARLCLAEGDTDWLVIAAPDDGKAHWLKVSVEQAAGTRSQIAGIAAADDTEMGSVTLAESAERTLHLVVGSGTKTYLKVAEYFGPGILDLKLETQGENDAYEPNDSAEAAAAIALDTNISAQLWPGYVKEDAVLTSDVYSVNLAAGSAQISFSAMPTNARVRVEVTDPDGTEVKSQVAVNAGAKPTVTFETEKPGKHTIRISDYFSGEFSSFISAGTPKHLTDVYTFRVEQE
jgi:hypothetical protein